MATKKKKNIYEEQLNNPLLSNSARALLQKKSAVLKAEQGVFEDIAPVRSTAKTSKVGSLFEDEDDETLIKSGILGSLRSRLSKKDDDEEERAWINAGLLKDGRQRGDIAKTILGTATDLDQNVKAGMLGIGEKVVDAAATGIGALGGALGNDKFKDKTRDFVAKDLYDEHKLASNPIIASNPFASVSHILGLDTDEVSIMGEKADDLAYSGGQLLGTVALQGVGVPWWVTTGATSFGSEVETAFNEGANYKEAALRGGISAGADILTEKLTGGIKFGGKTLDDALVRPLTQKISNKLARNLVNVGLDATGEGFEEVMASVANNLGEKLYNEDAKVKELLFSEEAVDEYIESFVGGFVLGGGAGGSSALQSAKTGRDYKTGLTDNEQRVVDAEVKKRISEQETDGKKLSAKEKTAIEEEVRKDLEKGYISIDSIESALGGETYNAYKALSDEMDEYTSLNKMKAMEMTGEQSDRLAELKEKNKQTSYESEKARLKQQLSQEVDGLTQSDTFLRESYNEKARKGQTFEADLTKYKSKEQQAIIQKAIDSKILNNTRRTHEFVDMISKIAADKGVSFDFTDNAKLKESGFAIDGKTVNGYVQGNNISLNIQSAKSLNKVVGHEITHVLEDTELYSELQKVVREYATTKGEYGTRLEALQALYKDVDGANIENELTADLIGDYLFTDEKFVNNLSTKNPNIFKKIYEEIKYLVKVATAGSKEAKELEKVKRIFEKVYKQTAKKNDTESSAKYALYLSEDDIPGYLKAGNRKNKNRQERYESGEQMVISSEEDFDTFVRKSIEGNPGKMVAYGVVESQLADQVKEVSEQTIDISDMYLELLSNDLKHAYEEHATAKEVGDLDMSIDDLLYALKNVNKGEVVNANVYKDGGQRIKIAISVDDGKVILVELASKSAGTLRLKTGWKITNDKFAEKYKSSSTSTGNESSTKSVRDDTASTNIIPESQENTTKFSLAGLDAVTADTDALLKAHQMTYEGSSELEVFQETGWFRGADGKWRFEIDDSEAQLYRHGNAELLKNDLYKEYHDLMDELFTGFATDETIERLQVIEKDARRIRDSKKHKTIKDYLEHPKLFDAYPFLANIPVEISELEAGTKGSYSSTNGITISKDITSEYTEKVFKKTLLHEIQHVIQHYERFAGGANMETWKGYDIHENSSKYHNAVKRKTEAFEGGSEEFKNLIRKLNKMQLDEDFGDEYTRVENELFQKYEDRYFEYDNARFEAMLYMDSEVLSDFQKYQMTAGEIEARDTANRSEWGEAERKSKLPTRETEHGVIFAENKSNPFEFPGSYSLSEEGQQDIAPIGNYNVYGSDIALDPTEDIAPVRSDIQQKNTDVRRGYKPLTEEQANARDKERMAAEFPPGISKIARNQIARELKEILPFAVSGQVKRVEEMIQRYADSENPDGNTLYMEIKEEFASNTRKRRIEEVADVQAALRSTKIAVSDAIKNGITDFNALRKSNFGKIRFAKDGLPVDTVYQELSMMYPNYFPEDIVNPSDQLLQMIDVANQERYANEEITADGKAIARATNHIMDRVEEYKESREERERRKRESRAYLHATIIDKIKTAFSAAGFDFDEVLKNAKNKSTFASVDNTPIRFIEKTFGYKAGQILNKLTMDQTALNESEGIKWLNSFTNRKNGVIAQIVKQYGIKPGSKESAAAQMYGEGFYVNDKNELIQYGEKELMQDFPDAKVRENIKKLATDPRIRQIYDETLDKINKSRTRNAYPEIPRRNNYFLHFRAMDDTFSKWGLPFNPNDIQAKDLPTDLNGVTADLKPGQPYFASANQRKGHKTTYDLLGGLEKYLTSAKNQIYHIDDIQTLRALRNYIANMFGQAHGLDNIDQMSEEEYEARIEKVYGSHLSTFARFLTEEANVLAGKTDTLDRAIESKYGRRAITFLDTVRKQVGQNMIGFNLSSSLTNLVSVVQGFSKANKADALKAFAQVAANKVNSIYGRSDGFADQNPLIIRRKGADRYTRTPWQKVSDTGFVFMSAIDNISTEFIVRAKYNELTRKGMDSETAHVESSKWAARILGDRSLGQMPQLYNSKIAGLIIQFQLEVRNQLDSMFYDTIQEAKLSTEQMEKGFKKNAAMAVKISSTVTQLAIFQALFGKAFQTVAGYDPTFNIISTIFTACGFDDEEDSEDTLLDNLEQAFLALMEDLPYTSTLTGGRIPISSAFPVEQLVTGTDAYGNDKPRWETLLESMPYYLMPTGFNQGKKTVQGLSMFDDDLPIAGSYTKNTVIDKVKGESPGNLRFSVEDTIPNKIQAGVFGQWANANARQYFDEGYAPLKEKQIQEYIDSGVSMQEYWDYRQGLSGLKTGAEKIDYIANLDLPIKARNAFANNELDRDEPVDLAKYDRFADFEEFDFATKNSEKYQFLKSNNISYKEYISDDDRKEDIDNTYSWVRNNPEKYELSKAVTDDVFAYKEYTSTISEFRADKDKNGKSISGTAKKKILAYINGLDITNGAKYILIKDKYPSDDSHNMDIIDYLNSRDDISYSEMKTILEELDFKVDEEGNISW